MEETNHTRDIVALGECLIDFVPLPAAEDGKLNFSGCPGGAPANVLACASRLGLDTAFIGKIGDDAFGRLLLDTIQNCGIDTAGMIVSKDYLTTLAFVTLDEQGDREFRFYRSQTADYMLREEEVDETVLAYSKIFHFGSVSMTKEPSRTTTMQMVKKAKEYGCMVSYDPNLREFLWDDLYEARKIISHMLHDADIVKLSGDELEFLTGTDTVTAGMEALCRKYSISCLVVTMGAEGSLCLCGGILVKRLSYKVITIDTVGAGDTFWGAFLYQVLRGGLDIKHPEEKKIAAALDFSNAAGAISTTRAGAIPAMPSLEEIRKLVGVEG